MVNMINHHITYSDSFRYPLGACTRERKYAGQQHCVQVSPQLKEYPHRKRDDIKQKENTPDNMVKVYNFQQQPQQADSALLALRYLFAKQVREIQYKEQW